MKNNETVAEANARYGRAAHAMQSGVAALMDLGLSKSETPKHLRVGINSAHVTDCAIAKLLFAKGVFTEAEYASAVADAMEAEAERYRKELCKVLGREVTLA